MNSEDWKWVADEDGLCIRRVVQRDHARVVTCIGYDDGEWWWFAVASAWDDELITDILKESDFETARSAAEKLTAEWVEVHAGLDETAPA